MRLAEPIATTPAATVRPLMAEAMVGMLDQVLKSPRPNRSTFPPANRCSTWPPIDRAMRALAYLLQLFGRGTRESVCDCDRTGEPTLRQTLHLMSDTAWIEQIQKSPLIDELLAEPDDRAAIEKVTLQSHCRVILHPTRTRAGISRGT